MSTGTLAPPAATSAQDGWGQQPQAEGLPSDWAGGLGGSGGAVDPLDGMEFDSEGVKLSGGKIEVEGAYHLEIREAEWPVDEHGGGQKLNRNNRKYISVHLVSLSSSQGLSPAGSSMWHEIEIPAAEDKNQSTRNGGNLFDALLSALCTFGVGCGVFQKQKQADGSEKVIDTATGTTKLDVKSLPERLKGRQVIGRPKKETWDANETKGTKAGWAMRFPWGNGVSQVGDPQNAMVPMFQAALDAAGLKRYQAPGQSAAMVQPGQAAVQQQSAQTTKPAPAQTQAPVQQQAPAAVPAGQYDDL